MRVLLLLLVISDLALAQAPLLKILGEELQRSFAVLNEKGDPAAYYIAYAVTEHEAEIVSASRGALTGQNRNHLRVLDTTVRVGSRELDNYRRVGSEQLRFTAATLIPLDDSAAAIRRRVWMETDRTYRAAAQRLVQIKGAQQTKVAQTDPSPDFSTEEPSVFSQQPPKLRFDSSQWAGRLRKLSAEFSKHPGILNSSVSAVSQRETKYLVSSEGTRLEHGRVFARVMVVAKGKASDGMDLYTQESFEANDPAKMPKDAEISSAIDRAAKDLNNLLRAPLAEPFVGPAILSGRAAGVFFHEIFGHRVEGHRQKDETEGQTFTKSVGTPVLPDFLSVIFDPTRSNAAGIDLNGAYLYDDEGIKARPVTVVEKGILKTFLMSRSPIRDFPNSNGHGRRQPGSEIVARQSNLIVESAKQVSDDDLRKMLLEEVKRQNKPYGLLFSQVTGGYTTTQRRGLQAFTVIPLVVYRVYADGRPDELIRGASIVGTPLSSFAKILATSNRPEVFNGYCGAESGNVPVSAVSPAILVSEIEIQRKDSSRETRPFLGPPDPTTGSSNR